MEQEKDQAFKTMLQMSGYSAKTADAICSWYTSPTRENEILEKRKLHLQNEISKQKINNPADNTLVTIRKH